MKGVYKNVKYSEYHMKIFANNLYLYSPTMLAEKYNVNVTSIRGWIKAAGKTLPQKYKFNATKQQTKPQNAPSPANSMSPAVDTNAPK